MLTLYFSPGACSMAPHIVLEESGDRYQSKQVHFADAEQRSEAYLKINPQGRVPALILDDGEPLAENTAILPFLGKRSGLWPAGAVAEARVLSLIGFLAASVHPSVAHMWRPERYAADPSVFPQIQTPVVRRSTHISNRSTASWRGAIGSPTNTRCRSLPAGSLSLGFAPWLSDARAEELYGF